MKKIVFTVSQENQYTAMKDVSLVVKMKEFVVQALCSALNNGSVMSDTDEKRYLQRFDVCKVDDTLYLRFKTTVSKATAGWSGKAAMRLVDYQPSSQVIRLKIQPERKEECFFYFIYLPRDEDDRPALDIEKTFRTLAETIPLLVRRQKGEKKRNKKLRKAC